MKTKRFLAGVCIALALCLIIAALGGIVSTHPKTAYGSITGLTPNPIFGNTQLVLSQAGAGTSTLNLSGTNSTSIPCYGMKLSLAVTNAAGVFIGSSSSSCSYPVYPTSTSGTAGSQQIDLPEVSNVNQLWVSLANSTTATYTATVNVRYAQ